jgi:hypothetical protein
MMTQLAALDDGSLAKNLMFAKKKEDYEVTAISYTTYIVIATVKR